MDLHKTLGLERPHITSIEVCEYNLWCPKCGYKSATWSVDNPTPKLVRDSFKKQQEYTFPGHAEHGTFTILEEKHSRIFKEDA